MITPNSGRDYAAGRSPLIITPPQHQAKDESDSLHTLLSAAADSFTTTRSSHTSPSLAAALPHAIDLELLLRGDSIDVDGDQQQQLENLVSLLERHSDQGEPSHELIRPEVTAVRAFLEEWQHDDDDTSAV